VIGSRRSRSGLTARSTCNEVDITDEAAARSFIEDSADALGGLDVLVDNAGVMLLGPVTGAEVEHWQRMINVNLLGLLYCTHAALPITGEGGGHIVNVSSVAGRQTTLGAAAYNMTKWGVVAFSEALRQEGLHANIGVTCVEPGYVDTELQVSYSALNPVNVVGRPP
jgi:NADP-dependent 3-hydroxy acid dehydrogenase YdfG